MINVCLHEQVQDVIGCCPDCRRNIWGTDGEYTPYVAYLMQLEREKLRAEYRSNIIVDKNW